MNRKVMMWLSVLVMSIVLVACGGNEETEPDDNIDTEEDTTEGTENEEDADTEDDSDMDPSSSGEVPDDLEDAEDPKYPVDSEAEIKANHMEGMEGAVGTIEGAYDTTVYEVTYEPTDGGEKVLNHKWVIHEEIEDAEDNSYIQGDKVVLDADHMEGMEGAAAEVALAKDTTVYMVSYEDTNTGEKVNHHKWVIEEELSSLK